MQGDQRPPVRPSAHLVRGRGLDCLPIRPSWAEREDPRRRGSACPSQVCAGRGGHTARDLEQTTPLPVFREQRSLSLAKPALGQAWQIRFSQQNLLHM